MTESKLTYMLTKLTGDQRAELCTRLGIGTSTFYLRRAKPGTFTLDEAAIICAYLEQLHGTDLDIYHLLNTQMDVLTEQRA